MYVSHMDITNQLQKIKKCNQATDQVQFRETPHRWSVFLLCNGECWIKQFTFNLRDTEMQIN